jgi:hypothetical protein
MLFECNWKKSRGNEKWVGKITQIENYGSHYEISIQSRSAITVIIGKTSAGSFACIPNFNRGCHLGNLDDIFWNTESLTRILGNVDGITVACALATVSSHINL